MTWQPIETAPKDGTPIWLFYPEAHEQDRQAVGWWVNDFREPRWMDHADAHDFIQPSHWMPLPEPPK
jgi:hypothetical protein